MGREDFLYGRFRDHFSLDATPCQDRFFRTAASFVTSDDADILVVNGYAGTGKTSAVAAVVEAFTELEVPCILMAPTGRSAKVLSSFTGKPASTIHKLIYRQKSVGEDGFGLFSSAPNKARNTLFVVDEVSLIGIDTPQQQSSAQFGTGNLLSDLISFVRSGVDCKLVMLGDSAQLPPLGLDESPALSHEFMAQFGGVIFETLTTVVRQKQLSGILYNATMLREMICDGLVDLPQFSLHPEDKELPPFGDFERIDGGELIEKISDAYDRWGEDETIVLCRSNRRAIRYNLGIRGMVQYKEERLVRGDKLMVVKNCYQFIDKQKPEGMDYIANGDIARLLGISGYEDRYGLHFADARLQFPDYDNQELVAKVCLDTLESESASLTYEQQNALYRGVDADYSDIRAKAKRYAAVREDHFYNALQLKYATAITGHKSQGGQWKCVFVDNPLWHEDVSMDDLKWLYTAVTRGVEKVYLVNFKEECFI